VPSVVYRNTPAFYSDTGGNQKYTHQRFSQTLFISFTPNLFGRMICLHELISSKQSIRASRKRPMRGVVKNRNRPRDSNTPYAAEQGIFFGGTGNVFEETGNFSRTTGKRDAGLA
jgi:hypothetical protein